MFSVRLDAETEAALDALTDAWKGEGWTRVASARRAIVERAMVEARDSYDAALARVRRQRERDA
jgi:predicted transcriptional regulator